MLCAFAPICIPGSDAGVVIANTAGIWGTRPTSYIDPAVTGVIADEGLINALEDQSPLNKDAAYGSPASKPTLDDDVVKGVFVARFSDIDFLSVTLPAPQVYWTLFAGLVSGGERVIVVRDTSQAGTTKPAFEIAIVEDLQ